MTGSFKKNLGPSTIHTGCYIYFRSPQNLIQVHTYLGISFQLCNRFKKFKQYMKAQLITFQTKHITFWQLSYSYKNFNFCTKLSTLCTLEEIFKYGTSSRKFVEISLCALDMFLHTAKGRFTQILGLSNVSKKVTKIALF